ncbi:uncharacterized protein JCM15063_004005 [Sporobolomyces koalae]|uniref:uncharacterized protein n=1 Tax=Sporobolomyces koalae TaxID=500713 RepID=UPI003178739A
MPTRRIKVYPYRIPPTPASTFPFGSFKSSSTSSPFHRVVSGLSRRKHVILSALSLLVLIVFAYDTWNATHNAPIVRLHLNPGVASRLYSHLPLTRLNATHSRLSRSYRLLHSDDPAWDFNGREPCNAPVLSVSRAPSRLNASDVSTPLEQWISPSPPLPPQSTLEERLQDFIDSPLSTAETHVRFNAQTCGSPSVKYNTNKLHQRENLAFWSGIDSERIREIRTETVRVLRDAAQQGRLEVGTESTRGIVWTAGNADTFDRVLVSLRLLRTEYSCDLPAEIFHFPTEHPSSAQLAEFARLGATSIPLESISKDSGSGLTKQFHIKGLALTASSFSQILYLDSDSIPARSPEFLFDSIEFQEYGAVFWNDYWKDTAENAIWRILGIQCRDEWTMESGQVLIDKRKHSDALILLEHWLSDWKFWFQFSDGDKDLLRYAFLLLRKRWSIPSHTLASASWTNPSEMGDENRDKFAGHTMVQFGLESEFRDRRGGEVRGRPLFVHGNLLKRIVGEFGNGKTWGRTLQLHLPRKFSTLPASNVTLIRNQQRADPINVDDFVNISPITGQGITQSYSDRPQEDIEIDDERRRIQALLARGIRTDFWDGHRGWNYVLGIQMSWLDELEGIQFINHTREDLMESQGGTSWEQWLRIEAQVAGPNSLRAQLLDQIRQHRGTTSGEQEGEEHDMPPIGEPGFMDIVNWNEIGELRGFEKRFYEAGGKANGVGF